MAIKGSLNNFGPEHNFICYFVELPLVRFTSKTGGELQREVTQQHAGGMSAPENIRGPQTVGQVTLTKPYDFILDKALRLFFQAAIGGIGDADLTLVCQPVTSEGIPRGPAQTYMNCTCVSIKFPDVNKGSSEAAMLEVVVQPRTVA